jgi:endonuclease/exonuclease/phosphatase family metal-dependent hydrolase
VQNNKRKKYVLASVAITAFYLIFAFASYIYNSVTSDNLGISTIVQQSSPGSHIKSGTPTTIKVLTFNVHGLPNTKDVSCDNLIKIGLALRDLRKKNLAPDIVAIQEGFHIKTRKLIELSGYPYAMEGPTGDKGEVVSGLWILSEYPIVLNKTSIFNVCISWDCLVNKGIQLAAIKLSGDIELQIFNTHMNSFPDSDPITSRKATVGIKENQINQFFSWFASTINDKLPAIVLGDFNFKARDPLYRKFEGLISKHVPINNVFEEFLGKTLKAVPGTVDHQFLIKTKNTNVKLVPVRYERMFTDRTMSDHRGVLVEYRIIKVLQNM